MCVCVQSIGCKACVWWCHRLEKIVEVVAIDITFHTCYDVCERRDGREETVVAAQMQGWKKKLYPIVASIKKDLKLKPLRVPSRDEKKMKNELSCGIQE